MKKSDILWLGLSAVLGGFALYGIFYTVTRPGNKNTGKQAPGRSNHPSSPPGSTSSKPSSKSPKTLIDLDAANPLNPSYLDHVEAVAGKSYRTLPPAQVKEHSDKIYQAWGIWGMLDDEDDIYAVFDALEDKVQVAQIAHYYGQHYKKVPLIRDIKSKLDEEEQAIVYSTIRKLENYRK